MFAGYRLMSGALECRAQHESVACDSIFAWSTNETFFSTMIGQRVASGDASELAGEVEADVREVLLCHLQDVAALR